MKASRNVLLSLEILAAQKLRTLLSVTGIVAGVGSVVLMVSVGRGAEKRILDRIRDMGTNLIVVNAGQTRVVAGRQRQLAAVTTLEPEDAAVIEERCASVALAAPTTSKKISVRWEAENTNANVYGLTPAGFRVRNLGVARGRVFNDQENRGRRRVAILGPTVLKNLFGQTDPLGLRIRVGRVPFEVIGITHLKGLDANGVDQDDLVLVPLATAMRRLLNVTHVQTIYVRARHADLLDEAEREVRDVLRERHRLRDKPDDFTIQNQATLLAAERQTARAMTLLIGSVASISLFVGGVGILAVMLMSVRERTREIGLRRALGARRRDIRSQFLVESSLLAGIGGLLGVFAGIAAAHAASALGYWETLISWRAAIVGFMISAGIGLVFGLHPAVRASRLEPMQALRSE
ncbi:ABC transporter permease [Planctomycetota bacterium]